MKIKRKWAFSNLASFCRRHLFSYIHSMSFLENSDDNGKKNSLPSLRCFNNTTCLQLKLTVVHVFFSIFCYSQNILELKCNSVEPENLSFVTVLLFKDSIFLDSRQCDSTGSASFLLSSNQEIIIDLRYLGNRLRDTVKVTSDTLFEYDLDKINVLSEVTISARKPLIIQQIDRISFLVENSIYSQGSNAFEMLKSVPGVIIVNDIISLIGKGSVSVLLDERMLNFSGDDLSNYLRSVPSDDILKIEIIKNPPAKYAVEGNAGLINIVLKKSSKQQFSGQFSGAYDQATYGTGSVNASINGHYKKVNYMTSASYMNGSKKQTFSNQFDYTDRIWDQKSSNKHGSENLGVLINLDYQPKDRTKMGVFENFALSGNTDEIHALSTFRSTGLDSSMVSGTKNKSNNWSNNLGLYLNQAIDTLGSNLYFETDYFHQENWRNLDLENELSGFVNNNSVSYRTKGTQSSDLLSFSMDLNKQLKKSVVTTGLKINYSVNKLSFDFFDNENGVQTLIDTNSNNYSYRETIEALYIDWTRTFGIVSLKLGLRGESTQLRGISDGKKILDSSYFQIFPTVFVLIPVNSNSSFNLTYGRRIDRPYYSQFNPFRLYSSYLSYSEGNPYLQPALIENFDLTFTHKNKWFTTLYVSITNNGNGAAPLFNSNDKIQVYREQNYYNTQIYGLTQLYIFSNESNFTSINQVSLFYNSSKNKLDNLNARSNGFGGYFYTSNTLVLGNQKRFSIFINGLLILPSVNNLYITELFGSLDLGVRMKFFHEKFNLSLSGSDILRTNQTKARMQLASISSKSTSYFDDRSVKLTLTYLFGNKKIQREDKGTNNENEIKRTNQKN